MTETRNKGKAMPSIDAALRDWPEAEKSGPEWDERAESVMGRLRRGERGGSAAYVSNDDLLSDPLGLSDEDGHNADAPGAPVIHSPVTPRTREVKMQTIDRDRDRKSLQDLAQMAKGMTPAPSSVAAFGPVPSTRSVTSLPNDKKDDSGIVDLAAASAADPEAAMRAQTTPLANQSLFDDVPPPPPVNAPPGSYIPVPAGPASVPQAPISGHHAHAYQQPAPSVPPPSVGSVPPPPAVYGSVHPIGPSLQKKKSGAGALVFTFTGILAIGAAAAGGFLYIRSHKPAAPVAATTVAAPTPPAVVADNTPAPKPAEPAAIVAENKPSDGATDLSSLPSTTPAAKSSGTKVAVRTASAKPAAKTEAADKPSAEDDAKAKADKAKLDQALAGNAAPAAPAGPPGDLGQAMKDKSGGGIMQEQKPAAGSSGSAGNVPQKPSQGAVTGALGAVLPAARDCLGPDDPISKASVVFNSDGSVASVSVSGSAAGKPAATCIEKEIRKAKVQPFAEPTYTANITIRHN